MTYILLRFLEAFFYDLIFENVYNSYENSVPGRIKNRLIYWFTKFNGPIMGP